MLNPKACVVIAALVFAHQPAYAAQCFYVSSYHTGYAWSDGVERGLRQALDGKCEITAYYMDSKRHKDEAHIKQAALEAKAMIDKLQPDVVIASDDNAAKYLIAPYFKDADIPFVFCGVNWTVKQYGFPYSNVTGMIEVAAIEPLFKNAASMVGKIKSAWYIGANTLTEKKNYARFEHAAKRAGIAIQHRLANTMEEWLQAYQQAQQADLIILGSNAGIDDWNHETVTQAISQNSHTLSVTNHSWMMPYTMFGMTKVPEEHGNWAGQIALEIINGTKPADIPIIPNRKFNLTINKTLLSIADIKVPEFIKLKARSHGQQGG